MELLLDQIWGYVAYRRMVLSAEQDSIVINFITNLVLGW